MEGNHRLNASFFGEASLFSQHTPLARRESSTRKIHPTKPAFRVLGVAECFNKKQRRSIIAAVSYRRDSVIDGFYITWVSVGGLDATDKIAQLVRETQRKDLNIIMLNGCIISWFNIVDIFSLYEELGIPVICLSYEESDGLEKYIREYFPGEEERLRLYRKLGERERVYIKATKSYVYARFAGLSEREVREVLNLLTLHGKTPEPLRLAQSLARSIHDFLAKNDPTFL
ncbi:MAG: DUF99 family protein [Infirmifilum sp.]